VKKRLSILGWLIIGAGVGFCAGPIRLVEAQDEDTAAPEVIVEEPALPVQPEVSDAAPEPPAIMTEKTAAETPAAAPAEDAGLVSIDFKDADIRQVLRVIALKSGTDIVAGNDVEGLVTIKLTNVPWEEALDIILRTYALTYERKGRIVRVMTMEALEQEALDTEVFPLDYATAKEVPAVIQEMLSERGRVKFDERTNTVIVTDVPSNLFQIKEVVERLDQRTPQVLIETRIVETKLEKEENLGIEWFDSFSLTQTASSYPSTFPLSAKTSFGALGENFISPVQNRVPGPTGLLTALPTTTRGSIGIGTLSNTDLTITLNMLKERTETKVVSNPTLAVLNNQEAKIHIGEEYPVPTFSVDPSTGKTTVSGFQSKTTGTVLTVTPHVNPSSEIVVDLKPEITTVGTPVSFNVGGTETVSLPRFGTQTVQTQVRIQDGQTIAIGGLVKDSKVVADTKVPFLGDIPLVGLLFRNHAETDGASGPTLQQDLLIFLTVTLSKERGTAVAVVTAPE
jgi:type IV pilus assembly protein PilQ